MCMNVWYVYMYMHIHMCVGVYIYVGICLRVCTFGDQRMVSKVMLDHSPPYSLRHGF